MTTCAVLRCQREATETFRPDETLGNFEVCREHLAQIHADALWMNRWGDQGYEFVHSERWGDSTAYWMKRRKQH